MDVVQKFLDLRRSGQGEAAFACLAPGAAFGCPWGSMHRGQRVHELLTHEAQFVKKGYLDDVPITPIDENTFQRTFKWDRGMGERGNSGFFGFGSLPVWREVYFVQGGKIRLVTAEKLRRNKTFWSLIGIDSSRDMLRKAFMGYLNNACHHGDSGTSMSSNSKGISA